MPSRSLRVGIVTDDPSEVARVRSFLAEDPDWDVEVVPFGTSHAEAVDAVDVSPLPCDVLVLYSDSAAEIGRWVPCNVPLIVVTSDDRESAAIALLTAGAREVLPARRLSLASLERAILTAVQRAVLERTVGERTRDLETENALLRKQRREIEAFHHTLSHELKTPLTSIREFVALISDGVAGPVTEEQREYLEICRRGCDQLKRVTNDLIDLSRIDTGKFSLHPAPTSIVDLIDEIIALEHCRAERSGIVLERGEMPGASDEPWTAFADSDRVKQILINFIDNALTHTPAGGSVRLNVKQVSVDPRSSEEDAHEFVISVADTGRGIPAEEQSRVFERHFQGSAAEGSIAEGMGLGLSLCKELVELHGGRTWLESTLGVGSEFFFTLPGRSAVPSDREVVTS